jgi:nucleolin
LTYHPLRYGFVSFEKKDDLMAACEAVDGSFWHGRRITCMPRNPTNVDSGKYYRNKNSPQQPTAQLFIGNMPYETTDADLNRLFRGIKNIKAVRVAVDRTTGWPRGFAHADFTSVEAATEAKRILEGITIAGRPLRIDYAEGYQRNRPTERPRAEKEFTTGSESDGSSSQWWSVCRGGAV